MQATESPCQFCQHSFDQDLLGIYGCPNCEGEGLDEPGIAQRIMSSISYTAHELVADIMHAIPWILIGCLIMVGLTVTLVEILGHCLIVAALLTIAVIALSLAIPSRKRYAVNKHTKKS